MVEQVDAKLFAANIQALISFRKHQATSQLPIAMQSWIESLSDRHQEQLGIVGLLNSSDLALTVEDLIRAFTKDYNARDDLAASTKTQFRTSMRRIPPMLKSKLVVDVSPKKKHFRSNAEPVFPTETKALYRTVESWQREHYAKSSWSRANGRMREVGAWAVANGICDYNPFTLLPVPGEVNEERNQYVDHEWILDIMEQCIHPDTRLLFALGRFAGLRLLSEARTMRPSHIEWDNGTLRIFDSKKKKFRAMPLFSEIASELKRHRDGAGWGRYILSSRTLTISDANATSLMKDAVKRTGHKQWSRCCQNLRASCENDWLAVPEFTEAMVTRWIGHTVKISRKHYQNETNQDRLKALGRMARN